MIDNAGLGGGEGVDFAFVLGSPQPFERWMNDDMFEKRQRRREWEGEKMGGSRRGQVLRELKIRQLYRFGSVSAR